MARLFPSRRRLRGWGANCLPLWMALSGCDKPKDPGPRAELSDQTLAAAPQQTSVSTEQDTATAAASEGGPTSRTGARVFSRSPRTWIYATPDKGAARLGYLRAGGSSRVTGAPVAGGGCAGPFVPMAPRGFVCLDRRATLDVEDPVVQATQEFPPDLERPLPYHYGTVRNPGPEYLRLPDATELRQAEPDFDERFPRWLKAPGEIGAGYGQELWLEPGAKTVDPAEAFAQGLSQGVTPQLAGVVPRFSGRNWPDDSLVGATMRPRAGYSILYTFLHQGRRYGLTSGLRLVPTDRLRPIRGSAFAGVRIGTDIQFPFALVRMPGAKFRSGKDAAYRAALSLTGKQRFYGKVLHYETTDGEWISDRSASRIVSARKMPGWAKKGEKWIDVNLSKQALMLYEGETPVFATLVSSGEAGLGDPETSTATKRGIFRIHTKHATSTMSSSEVGEEFELQDVPYVMYFDKEGYALHGAYWHDRFGTPKSHGCINLSPTDARTVFHWTEPGLPTGWHGVLEPRKGTVIFVHP